MTMSYKFQAIIAFTLFFSFIFYSCQNDLEVKTGAYSDITSVSAMKNVMWKGELEGVIDLDTIQPKMGLYGLGPVSFLQGELLIKDGQIYSSRVLSDSTMEVLQPASISAPFFVYGNVTEWKTVDLSTNVTDIPSLEAFIDQETKAYKRPFVFRLEGRVKTADIHIQNLAPGSIVRSPEEAHQGQVNYLLADEKVEIIGFFSTKHQGVFTHHDSYVHLHLITQNEEKMGHLDDIDIIPTEMTLYLPVK